MSFKLQRIDIGGSIMLVAEGELGATAAQTIGRALGHEAKPCVIDVSRVRRFDDLAVPELSRILRRSSARIRGLGQHWQRLFRYYVDEPDQPAA